MCVEFDMQIYYTNQRFTWRIGTRMKSGMLIVVAFVGEDAADCRGMTFDSVNRFLKMTSKGWYSDGWGEWSELTRSR